MIWKKRKRLYKGKTENYSLLRKLRKEKNTTDELEILLNSLSLEEIIGLKLELASKAAGSKLYGLPIWFSLQDIVKEAVFKYAISATRTKGEAIRFLGLTPRYFRDLYKKYKIDSYFEIKENNNGQEK
jgi:hypothetical protein